MTLGQRISQYRKALGISQEELGARLGVSRQAVSKWETGAAAPDMENLLALAREFRVSVAELTQTPEPPAPAETGGASPAGGTDGAGSPPPPRRRGWWIGLGLVVAVLVFMSGTLIILGLRSTAGQVSDIPEPVDTEFYLTWQVSRPGHREWYEYLALGAQDSLFPFGTSLTLTEPEEVVDTDYHLTTLHRADCGAVQLDYLHMGYDSEVDPAPEQESVTKITTMVRGYTTPRGIGVGDTKEDLLRAYGDELVYCLKEESGYSLVPHDCYYVYSAFEDGLGYGSILFYMKDGLTAGICLEMMQDAGDAYAPNNVTRFPLVNGEPDFSQRQEPEREDRDATQQVYIAWNQLVTNNNLSAEELYEYRRDVFSLLPDMDWGELQQMGSAENPDDAIFGLMTWLEQQAPYSSAEILWVQMGCTATGLDGAYSERYADVLAKALFSDTLVFAKALATDGVEETTKRVTLLHTTYAADLYPAELKTALDTLDSYMDTGAFTDTERGWAELLRLYLATPIYQRSQLPDSPAGLEP